MRLGWVALLVLSFPVLEAVSIFWVADRIGAWALLWLLLAAVGGVLLIRFERVAWGARVLFTLQSGMHPLAALFTSGRVLLAGGLLVFPGFLSDIIALGLLLMPGTWRPPRPRSRQPANDDVLEGEFRREFDDRLP